jgi:hypothetical protein
MGSGSPATKEDAKQRVHQLLLRGPHLADEITQDLELTRGGIPCRGLAVQLARGKREVALFCHNTVQSI